MSERCACETLKGTQCSFNRKAPSNYCGKHTPCKKDWGHASSPRSIPVPRPMVQVPHQALIQVPRPRPVHTKCEAINKSNGKPCSNSVESGNIYCGTHLKSLDESLSQAELPVEARRVAPATYNIKRVKPDGRLSARWYWDNHPESLGDRCNIRKDGIYNCLLVDSAGRPKWFPKSVKESELQRPCGNFSSKCKEPEFV